MLRRTPSSFSPTSCSVSQPCSVAIENSVSPRWTAYSATLFEDSGTVVPSSLAASSIVDAANDRVPSRHPALVAREATTTHANGAVEIERMMRRHVHASVTMRTRAREWPDERVNA